MQQKHKKIIVIACIAAVFIVILILCGIRFFKDDSPLTLGKNPQNGLGNPVISIKDEQKVELGTKLLKKDFILELINATLENPEEVVDTTALGTSEISLSILKIDGEKTTYKTKLTVIDTTPPVIHCKETVELYVGEHFVPLSYVTAIDNSKESITVTYSGTFDTNKTGNYTIIYTAKDKSNNIASKTTKLLVKEKPVEQKNPYFITVNRSQNVVVVYGLDNQSNYNKIVKTFVCSVGTAVSAYTTTPTGTFSTTNKYIWRRLDGNVYGQYATRITRDVLFHSVPYFSQSKSELEYQEYNKLGSAASLGCVRLSVIDAKWIYDNCPSGTSVKIYDSNSLPQGIAKPTAQKIPSDSPNKGWDPTDPDQNNPWKK